MGLVSETLKKRCRKPGLANACLAGQEHHLTFACLGTLASTFVRDWPDFDLVQIVLLPMFLFSGTFYPLSVYPPPLQGVVEVLPLYHGIHLLRSFTTGTIDLSLLVDIAYLVLLTALALRLTRSRLVRRLLR